jgi:hypothetical protein
MGLSPIMAAVFVLSTGFITHRQYPTHDIEIAASADPATDQPKIDAIVRGEGLALLTNDPKVGQSGDMPCIGHVLVLASYRLTDASGIYLGKLDDGRISVTLVDTAKLGGDFTDQDTQVFSNLIDKLSTAFGPASVTVAPNWRDHTVLCLDGPAHPLSDLDN